MRPTRAACGRSWCRGPRLWWRRSQTGGGSNGHRIFRVRLLRLLPQRKQKGPPNGGGLLVNCFRGLRVGRGRRGGTTYPVLRSRRACPVLQREGSSRLHPFNLSSLRPHGLRPDNHLATMWAMGIPVRISGRLCVVESLATIRTLRLRRLSFLFPAQGGCGFSDVHCHIFGLPPSLPALCSAAHLTTIAIRLRCFCVLRQIRAW
jgi:hypothetical protein